MFYWGGGGGGELESSQFLDSVMCLVKVKISNKKMPCCLMVNVKKFEICLQRKGNTTIRDVKITLLGS